MKKTVLVTGGAGFIGSHLSEALLAKGYGVRVLDSLVYGQREWVPAAAEFIEGDLCDKAICDRAAEGVDGIFHAAAMSRPGPSSDSVEVCTASNIVGTQNILLAARTHKVRKLVYSASCCYYGSQPIPHREYETPNETLNFYGLTKQVGEQYCLLFDTLFDVPTVVLRYFNVYGPRQPETGAYALVLGIFLRARAKGEPLNIHGTGAQRRDFVHVSDVVRANIAAYESDARRAVFNVGSGQNISVKELADLISPHQVFSPPRQGDAKATLADITRIREALGWEPQVNFADGLRDIMRHMGIAA